MVVGCNQNQEDIDWNRYYESQYKTPFGTSIFRSELKRVLEDAFVKDISKKTDELIEDNKAQDGTYFYINPRYYPNKLNSYHLFQLAKNENALFIATNFNDPYLLSELQIAPSHIETEKIQLKLHFLEGGDKDFKLTAVDRYTSFFSKIPANAKILGSIKVGNSYKPNFIQLSLKNQSGQILLHANPELFSNYCMLQNSDGLYALNTLHYVKKTSFIYWDGYDTYRRYTQAPVGGGMGDTLRYIWSSPPLTAAFWIALGAMVLFAGFNYKRVVRSIPVHKPLKNNSLAFATLVGNLFMEQENHIDLARYRSIYLLDTIKRKFNLDTSELDELFTQKLAEKSQVSINELSPLIRHVQRIKTRGYIDKTDFISFTKTIDTLHKKLNIT
jgi:hypothetical protein